jgi:hypothetical protein
MERSNEDQQMLDEQTQHYSDLQNVEWSESELATIYEYHLQNRMTPPVLSSEQVVTEVGVDIIEGDDLINENNTRKVEVITISGQFLKPDQIIKRTYVMSFNQLIDFIRGTIDVAEDVISIKML